MARSVGARQSRVDALAGAAAVLLLLALAAIVALGGWELEQAGPAAAAVEALRLPLTVMTGLALLALVAGALVVWLGRRQLSQVDADVQAISMELSRVFNGLAEGDLSRKVGGNHSQAFVRMADDVNATMEKLAGMITRINEAAGNIRAAASEVAAGGTDLSERTEREAAALEQTAAAIEQLSNTFKVYCDHAHEANAMVSGARESGETGVAVVALAIESMQRIVEASEKIKEIIRVTEEISRRINMLAINAAVEAARAGEAGKGFGVVAREVGGLAERSARASQQIKELILNSDMQIKQGVQSVTQSGEALRSIVGSVDRAAKLFNDIAISAAGQLGMLHEINAAVGQLDETTQMNAALAEQTCAASQSMRQEAAGLKELVSFFTTDANASRDDLGRHIVLIESTKLDHISFMKRVHETIAGERNTAPGDLASHHQCRLGKWYDTIELPIVQTNMVFRSLEAPHATVHDAARLALENHQAGNRAACDHALAEMERASAQVLGLIDRLAADLRRHDAEQHEHDRVSRKAAGAGRTLRRPALAVKPPSVKALPASPPPPRSPARSQGPLRHADAAGDREWTEF